MLISDLEFYLVEVPCDAPSPAVRSVVARLSTYSGLDGWGEAPLPWRAGELSLRREALLPILTGRSVFDTEELLDLHLLRDATLRSAIETACWDLIGRLTDQPICRLLGGEYRHRVPTAVQLPPEPLDRLMTLAREWAGKGLHWQVMRCTGDPENDAETARMLHDAVGGRVEFRLDGQSLFDMEAARDLCMRIETLGVAFLLDPLRAPESTGDQANREIDQLAALARQVSVPLAATRAINDPHDLLQLTWRATVPFVGIDPRRVGGILGTKQCATVARAARLRAMLGAPPSLGIAAAADLQLAACSPAFSLGVATSHDRLQDDVLAEPLEIVDGLIPTPLGPGLGVEVDRAKIEHFAVTS